MRTARTTDRSAWRLGWVLVVAVISMGALAACGLPDDGGGGPTDSCPEDLDVEGVEANGTIGTADAVVLGQIHGCNDHTTGDTDVDVFAPPTSAVPGTYTVYCVQNTGTFGSATASLLNSVGTPVASASVACGGNNPAPSFSAVVAAGQFYLQLTHASGSQIAGMVASFVASP